MHAFDHVVGVTVPCSKRYTMPLPLKSHIPNMDSGLYQVMLYYGAYIEKVTLDSQIQLKKRKFPEQKNKELSHTLLLWCIH